jgi:hypothetical protein
MSRRRSFALLAACLALVACADDPSPPDAPPMTFAYSCGRAKDCPIEHPTMVTSSASVTMLVHGEADGASYTLRAVDKETVKLSAHTSTCQCVADDLARTSGSCEDGKANVCAHRFIVEGLKEGDTTIEVVDGDRVVASTPFKVRKAASVDVTVTPVPKDAEGNPLRYSGSGVSFAVAASPAIAHDSIAPGPVEVAKAIAPGTGMITVTSGDAKADISVRVLAP